MRNETLWKLIAEWLDYNDDYPDDTRGMLKKADKIDDHIETLLQESIKTRMLELLAFFDDYSHPLEMTAEYVKEQIIKFMEDNK